MQQLRTAYHEAGRVVVAYCFGWWLAPEGVEIDEAYTGLRYYKEDCTKVAQLCVNCAGRASEVKLKLVPWVSPPSVRDLELAIEESQGELHEQTGDEAHSMHALRQANPRATDEQLIADYRRYETATYKLLDVPVVWRSIGRISAALMAGGKLFHEDVWTTIVWEMSADQLCGELNYRRLGDLLTPRE
jgi:hypothetical protein